MILLLTCFWKTAAGMIGDAKDLAAILKWYTEFFASDSQLSDPRPFVWSVEVREDVNTAVVGLVAGFLSAEGAHRKAHGITATTKKAIIKESTSYREYVHSKRLELHWVRTPGPTDNEVIWEEWRSKRMPRLSTGEEGFLVWSLAKQQFFDACLETVRNWYIDSMDFDERIAGVEESFPVFLTPEL